MTLKTYLKFPDDIRDDIGTCLRKLHSIPTWTAKKFAIYREFEQLAERERYLTFTADFRDYHLVRKGQSCIYVVPADQRGALRLFAGKRIRLVCGDTLGAHSKRIFYANPINEREDGLPTAKNSALEEADIAHPPKEEKK